MTMLRLFILLTIMTALTAISSYAADPPPADANIIITAETMNHEQATDMFKAIGSVVIKWSGMTLTSDQASYFRTKGKLYAVGNVRIDKDGQIIVGESAVFDVETGRGEVDKGTYSIPLSNASLTGEKLIRLSDSELESKRGDFTTCDLPDPSWKFGSTRFYYNSASGYATGRNVIFYIKGVPVMYIPWMAVPVIKEKQSGFLLPRYRSSKLGGQQIDIPFYWDITPNQDAIIDLDIQSKRGVGLGFDYRYLRKRGSEGNIAAYMIYDVNMKRFRGMLAQNHIERFSTTSNLRVSVNLNTKSFWTDFGEKSGDYNRQYSDTVVNYLKTYRNYAFTAGLRLTEDLYATSNSGTVQTLPELAIAGVRQKIFSTPLYFDVDAVATNFYRETGVQGQRLTVFPRVTVTTGLPGYLNASAYAGMHLHGYNTGSRSPNSGMKELDGMLQPEAGARISTAFSKVYSVDGKNMKKLRHELSPEISYTYAPKRDQGKLPLYDYNDRLIQQNTLYYGVTSLLSARFNEGDKSSYRDISHIRLFQGYSFDNVRRDLLTTVDTNRRLSDLILETETIPIQNVKILFDARYNTEGKYLTSTAPGMEIYDDEGNTANLSYRMSRNQNKYIQGGLVLKKLRPFTFSYTTRYSFDSKKFLSSDYSIEYKHKCWSIIFGFNTRPGSWAYTVNFTLAGLSAK